MYTCSACGEKKVKHAGWMCADCWKIKQRQDVLRALAHAPLEDNSYDGLRDCDTCGDVYVKAPATTCHRCLQQRWIDKYG